MFDLARFAKLAAATWLESRRAWLWFLGIGIIVHFVLMLVMLVPADGFRAMDTKGQGFVWYAGLYTTAPIFAARYFQAMARRESALVLLMRPASAFEKWLLAMLIVIVLYPVAYTLAFQVCNLPTQWYSAARTAAWLATDPPEARGMVEAYRPENYRLFLPWRELEGAAQWAVIGLSVAALQGFALLGSLYFRSFPFIKTVLAGFIVMLAMIFVSAVGGGDSGLFFGYWLAERELSPLQQVLLPLAWFAIPGLLWLASLFALREREVA